MTNLNFETYFIPSASLGEESALPDIHVNSYIRANIELSDKIDREDGKYVGKGMISTLLPYRIMDGYDRNRSMRGFNAAILENDEIKAVFLPEIGGRLWSLYDKKCSRELLYKNDVFQPANLALRNAWFSGGVEWNVGIKGHNPLTCSPLFVQKVYNAAGDPILRMYEFERIRGVVYIIEATLKNDALVMNMTIENTAKNDTPMYWWSNIAVPETPGTRVITPAKEAFYCSYTDGKYFLDKSSIPYIDGKDITYASNSMRSRDYFFNIPDHERKWIAAVDEEGKGLLQFSDAILKGRKLFVWGQHAGGRHWNQWLSQDAGSYIEIQAGLLKTQLEHFVMKKESVIRWRESYCAVDIDPMSVHGAFSDAADAISPIVEEKLSLPDDALFNVCREEPIRSYGSGWGALEEMRRKAPISNICKFPEDSIQREQRYWISLLKGETLPSYSVDGTIESYVVGADWIVLLEKTPAKNWYDLNQLGVLYYANGDIDRAEECFSRSFALEDNAWARRNLAQIQKNIRGDLDAAATNMLRALALRSDDIRLAVECFSALIKAERHDDLYALHPTLPEAVRQHGRIRMLLGDSCSRSGRVEEARALISPDLLVPDIMEGEYALSNIWYKIYSQVLAAERGVQVYTLSDEEVFAAYPLPFELDYRMH